MLNIKFSLSNLPETLLHLGLLQCCGSGFGLDSDPREQKWATKIEKKNYFIFWSAGCSLLSAEGFSCSLDVIYRILFFIFIFFFSFWSSTPGSGSGSGSVPDQDSLEMLDPDLDPQHCCCILPEVIPSPWGFSLAWTLGQCGPGSSLLSGNIMLIVNRNLSL